MAPYGDEAGINCRDLLQRARERAVLKALTLKVTARLKDYLVIGADQIIAVGTKPLSKPKNLLEATNQLAKLSNRSHRLINAISVARYQVGVSQPSLLWSAVFEHELTMRKLSKSDIENYVNLGEWQGCAGSYRFEEQGITLFKTACLRDDEMMGLPLIPLLEILRAIDQDRF